MANELDSIQQHFAQSQQPNLGYGKQSEASIDSVNQWMRAQPWWQSIAGRGGQLSDQQRQMILRQAQANGVVVDEGDMEIDPAGNFNPKGHKLRNSLIVGGIAAGALLGGPALLGAFGGGGGAAGGAGAAGAAGSGAGSLAAIEGGAYGLNSAALAGLGTGAMGAVPVAGSLGAGAAGAAAAGAGGVGKTIARHIGTEAGDVAGDSFKKQLASALALLGGTGVGHMFGGGGGQSSAPPELAQLLQMSMKQQTDLDPLRQNVTRGVNAMLPTFARGGS